MRYGKPELHSLTPTRAPEGQCATGTGASASDGQCLTGNTPGFIHCKSGDGAGRYCQNGAAASDFGLGYCAAGTGVDTGCGTGNTPVG